jgi:hypothetical protein
MFDKKREKLIEALSIEQQDSLKKGNTAFPGNGDSIGQNLSELKKVQDYLYQIKDDIHNEASQINWEKYALEIIRKAKIKDVSSKSTTKEFSNWFFKAPYKLGFAAVSIIAFGLIFLFLMKRNDPMNEQPIIQANSVENMENTLAKNETVEYLRQSGIVLSSVANMPTRGFNNDALKQNADQAKSLLLKKKYINRNLNNYELSNAQSICNQVEYLLYDISQLKNSSDTDSLNSLKTIIQDKKIMLKIKLVQSEITNKEV